MNDITSTKEDNIIVITIVGKVTPDDILEHVKNNIDTWVGFPELWDLSCADLSGITSVEWQEMLIRLHPFAKIKKGEKAALVSSRDLAFGMMRMLESVSEGEAFPIKLSSFRKKEDAKTWLSD